MSGKCLKSSSKAYLNFLTFPLLSSSISSSSLYKFQFQCRASLLDILSFRKSSCSSKKNSNLWFNISLLTCLTSLGSTTPPFRKPETNALSSSEQLQTEEIRFSTHFRASSRTAAAVAGWCRSQVMNHSALRSTAGKT